MNSLTLSQRSNNTEVVFPTEHYIRGENLRGLKKFNRADYSGGLYSVSMLTLSVTN